MQEKGFFRKCFNWKLNEGIDWIKHNDEMFLNILQVKKYKHPIEESVFFVYVKIVFLTFFAFV